MKLAAFFSGGKDSAYAIYDAKKSGHIIQVLFTILPKSDESHLLHFPNIDQTKIQSESMNIPQIIQHIDSIKPDIEEFKLWILKHLKLLTYKWLMKKLMEN